MGLIVLGAEDHVFNFFEALFSNKEIIVFFGDVAQLFTCSLSSCIKSGKDSISAVKKTHPRHRF
ncbi:MAG: hypothetical protein RJB13_1895 [Pseudomonadota bacterium]|jgi:hypothetical protein